MDEFIKFIKDPVLIGIIILSLIPIVVLFRRPLLKLFYKCMGALITKLDSLGKATEIKKSKSKKWLIDHPEELAQFSRYTLLQESLDAHKKAYIFAKNLELADRLDPDEARYRGLKQSKDFEAKDRFNTGEIKQLYWGDLRNGKKSEDMVVRDWDDFTVEKEEGLPLTVFHRLPHYTIEEYVMYRKGKMPAKEPDIDPRDPNKDIYLADLFEKNYD